MPDFVLVKHDNGLIGPVSRSLAEKRELDIQEGDALDVRGRPVKATRANGRRPKKKTSVAKKAAEKKAVVPSEGAAESALSDTTTKE